MPAESFFRKPVLELDAYHLDTHEGIKLNQNESPWDLPVPLKAQIVENLLKVPWNRYPPPDPIQLKKKMAKYLNVWPDNIVFANGSNVLIQALVMATSVGGKVMVLEPSFGVYAYQAQLLDNKVVAIPLEPDFSLPVKKMLRIMKKEKPNIIFIPNPNAPTGTLFDFEAIKEIVQSASCPVVIDEAYYPFSTTTMIDWIRSYDNLVILRTFSKAMSLGGLRLGWLIAEPDVARHVQKCLLPFCMSRLTYETAMVTLDNMDYVEKVASQIREERDRVWKEMQTVPAITPYPSKANFILFDTADATRVFKGLIKEGILVRVIKDLHRLQNTLRVTIGTKDENNSFLTALRKVVG